MIPRSDLSWIPALRLGSPVPAALAQAGRSFAGMTPRFVSAVVLNALRFGHLAMT